MIPARFRYVRPTTVVQALQILRDEPDARVLAGGQSLLTALKHRTETPEVVVDIGRLTELRQIRPGDGELSVGAMVTFATLGLDADVRARAPMLPAVTRHVADVQVRNRGTIGGSLAYGDPCGDLPAAVIAAHGRVRLASLDGEREVRVEDLYTGPFSTVVAPTELVVEVTIPRHDTARVAYDAVARRPADPTLAGVALVAVVDDNRLTDVGVGLVGLGDRPLAGSATADALRGHQLGESTDGAAAALATEIAPLDNAAGRADYRGAVAPVALDRALGQLTGNG